MSTRRRGSRHCVGRSPGASIFSMYPRRRCCAGCPFRRRMVARGRRSHASHRCLIHSKVLETSSSLASSTRLSRRTIILYGELRFRMLETVCDYALEQLRQRGDYDDAMRRLADYVCGVARSFSESSDGDDRRYWSETSRCRARQHSRHCFAGRSNGTTQSSYCRSRRLPIDTGGGQPPLREMLDVALNAPLLCRRPPGCRRSSPRCCCAPAAPSALRWVVRKKPYPCCSKRPTRRSSSTTTGFERGAGVEPGDNAAPARRCADARDARGVTRTRSQAWTTSGASPSRSHRWAT